MKDYVDLADYLAAKVKEYNESSWICVPIIYRIRVAKSTNKLYVPHKICRNAKVSVTKCDAHLNHEVLKIDRVRSKSIVLKKPVQKEEHIYIAYYVWRFCKVITMKAEDYPTIKE